MDAAIGRRVYVYVDGFNLFNGLRDSNLRRYYWLDLGRLSAEFLKPGQVLGATKYFTARIVANPEKSKRQSTYLDALQAVRSAEVFEGRIQMEPFYCSRCHNRRPVPKEKQTDTNIASEMVADAFLDRWDTAFVVSGDADLVPPIRLVRRQFPAKKVLVAFPPARSARELSAAADGAFHIGTPMLARCQLPPEVRVSETVVLRRPDRWNGPVV